MSNERKPGEPPSGLTFPTGDLDAARSWVGRTSESRVAPEPVNGPMVRLFASVMRDENPCYWDSERAAAHWGERGILAPPAMLLTWKMPLPWHPDGEGTDSPVSSLDVPLPLENQRLIMRESSARFHRPLFEGERLHWQATITDVSDAVETRLGTGHFVTNEARFHTGDGSTVAEHTTTVLRHEAQDVEPDPDPQPATRRPDPPETAERDDREQFDDRETVSVGDPVPSFRYPVSYRRAITNVTATREFVVRGLYDPESARAQGAPTIFLNAIALQGLVDRLAVGWSGPDWRVSARELQFRGVAPAGETLVVGGEVTAVDEVEIAIDATIRTADGTEVCTGTVRITNVVDGTT